jgi:c-di-GMP-binding flagellar brake protein YcgR
MTTHQEPHTNSAFEIDSPTEFGQFFLKSRREIVFYLQLLAKQRSIVTTYLDGGQHFFLSSVVAVDESQDMVCLDPSSETNNNHLAQAASQITLVTNLDRIKIQTRLHALKTGDSQGQEVLCARLPESIFRLQRREFFRLETPIANPVFCKLARYDSYGAGRSFDLILSDISGGGLCLSGPTNMAENFPRDALFQDCRLEIPGEGVIQVNLRVRKAIEISDRDGEHSLRIGCEFVNLSDTRLAFIERYIARIERERKARDAGLFSH